METRTAASCPTFSTDFAKKRAKNPRSRNRTDVMKAVKPKGSDLNSSSQFLIHFMIQHPFCYKYEISIRRTVRKEGEETLLLVFYHISTEEVRELYKRHQ